MQGYQTSRFTLLPPVVKNLLIINILMFFATETLLVYGIDLRDMLGLHWIGSTKFHSYQIITYMFMHGSFEHIFFNMFAVWMFGNAIENAWGSKRFLIYYLFTGIGAAFLHYSILYFSELRPFLEYANAFLADPSAATLQAYIDHVGAFTDKMLPGTPIVQQFNSAVPSLNNVLNGSTNPVDVQNAYAFMEVFKEYYLNLPNVIGASGSLFGILLAFGMMFPNVHLFLIFFPIPIKAKYFVAIYGIVELVSGIANNPYDNVAHFAHVGGMLFGYILIRYWQRKQNRPTYYG